VSQLSSVPPLRDPVMVAAFEGWNDAGEAASGAVAHLARVWDATSLTELDPEDYHDFQVNRPLVQLDDDGHRSVTWPTTRLYWATPPGASRDVVLVRGIEPSMRWRAFVAELLEYAEQLGVTTIVTLGALLADVPHTRPIPVTTTSDDDELMQQLALEPSTYQGPTGIVGVLQEGAHRAGLPGLSLWAAVPHYVAAVPNPKAALALLRRLEGLTGIAVDASELEEETADYEEQIGRAVAANPEIEELVTRIEAEQAELIDEGEELPSADTLAREFQRFLRQRGDDKS
jgi:proteasome assembly chaperone (PAC2) family protein